MTALEMEKGFEEIRALFKETDKKINKTSKDIDKTNSMLSEKFMETDRKFSELKQIIGRFGGRWGEFVEGMVAPAVVNLFSRQGIDISRIYQRITARKNGNNMEIDILGVDSSYAVAVEVKSHLKNEEVKEFLEKMDIFKEFFPEYADKKFNPKTW